MPSPRPPRPLTALEMGASVAAMTVGAGLVGLGWALPQLGAVGFGVVLIVVTPLGMLHVQGVSPLDQQVADDF